MKNNERKIPNILGNKSMKGGNGNKGFTGFLFTAIAAIITIFIFLYVATGGINQRKLLEQIFPLGRNIGENSAKLWKDGNMFKVNEDGVYLNP